MAFLKIRFLMAFFKNKKLKLTAFASTAKPKQPFYKPVQTKPLWHIYDVLNSYKYAGIVKP